MTTMTHAKYNELQKKMDKLADDYLILEKSRTGGAYYIPKKDVLEFELNRKL